MRGKLNAMLRMESSLLVTYPSKRLDQKKTFNLQQHLLHILLLVCHF